MNKVCSCLYRSDEAGLFPAGLRTGGNRRSYGGGESPPASSSPFSAAAPVKIDSLFPKSEYFD